MIPFLQSAAPHVIPLLAVITLIVTIHELGHFWAGRAFGVAIERFSIGFGPTLSLGATALAWNGGSPVPLGGYVRFALDENVASVPDNDNLEAMRADIQAGEGPGAERKYLPFKPLWQRAIISVAGPGANFILSLVLFSALFTIVGAPQSPFQIGTVESGSPAAGPGFNPAIISFRPTAIPCRLCRATVLPRLSLQRAHGLLGPAWRADLASAGHAAGREPAERLWLELNRGTAGRPASSEMAHGAPSI